MGIIPQLKKRRAELESRVAASEAERAGQPVVITIARDFGAEGHEIGKMLSAELGIPLYDNEILVRSSIRAGESMDRIAAYDEQLAAENMAFLPDRVDARNLADKLFEKMAQVIIDLGSTESCIIEGRLSDYLLRANPNHIAVLVTAPLEDRIQIVSKKRGLNHYKGAQLVKKQQRAREQFYKRYSAGKWRMDMGKDLPEYEEIPVPLRLPENQQRAYDDLEHAFHEIFKDRSCEGRKLARKLLSVSLNLMMAYPDQPYGHKPIVHPVTADPILVPEDSGASTDETEKDARALEIIRAKVAAEERVLPYVNWVRLDSRTRLKRFLTDAGVRAEIMEDTVPPRRREEWVANHLRQGMQVMIVNPAKIEKGCASVRTPYFV